MLRTAPPTLHGFNTQIYSGESGYKLICHESKSRRLLRFDATSAREYIEYRMVMVYGEFNQQVDIPQVDITLTKNSRDTCVGLRTHTCYYDAARDLFKIEYTDENAMRSMFVKGLDVSVENLASHVPRSNKDNYIAENSEMLPELIALRRGIATETKRE